MSELPTHPYTGLTAIGYRRDGRPIWPIRGGDGTPEPPPPAGGGDPPPSPPAGDPPNPPAPPQPDPPKPDPDGNEPLGDAGKKALQEERAARKELEKEVKQFGEFKTQLAQALGLQSGSNDGDDKTELQQLTERITNHETELANERDARWRAEIANQKGLTNEQAAELKGATREELAAHADRLKTLFTPTTGTPGTPRPDHSQGSRGPVDLDAQIREAESKGNVREAISLKNRKLLAQTQNT